MGQQLFGSSSSHSVPRLLTFLLAGAGLVGSLAAIALPASVQVSEIASVLAVASLALLAGHQWGLIVLVAADVVLLGRVWPSIVYEWPPTMSVQLATYAALAGALPGLFLIRRTVPHSLELIFGSAPSHEVRVKATAWAAGLSALWLVLPIVR